MLAAILGYRALQLRLGSSDAGPGDRGTPGAVAEVPPLMLGTIAFRPCSLAAPANRTSLEAQCASFEVPEDRSRPDGRRIALNIAWLEASARGNVEPDPVFFLAGGPGQAAVTTYPALDPVFAEVRRRRHLILVDQRGTGGSNRLTCEGVANDDADTAPSALAAAARACVQDLASRADLRHYTTTDAVADLEAVRQAIDAAQLNLVGVSYGTRVAQQYAMRHPQATRSIVLDSPVPNSLGLGNIFARNLDDALALQFALCSSDPACRSRLGDPRAELDVLLGRLRTQPVNVRYRDATSGELRQGVLHAETVAGLVRMYAYMPLASALLPKLIHEANGGHYAGLMALAQMMAGELMEAMAMGMQMSVVCSEDSQSMVARAEDAATVLGNPVPVGLAAICGVWPRATLPADFHQALSTDVPALVLAGELDPITPPRYGAAVVKTLSRGRLFVLRGQGHSVLGAGCMPRLFAQFIDKADARGLDGTCLARLDYAAPFTSFNGAGP
ncbi:MAG: alpha/beta fold hydrolase [Gammaproteobacteria bacterium]|nr:alpha/beta fold hydrolase [Gammaproteobacteria bacterium]